MSQYRVSRPRRRFEPKSMSGVVSLFVRDRSDMEHSRLPMSVRARNLRMRALIGQAGGDVAPPRPCRAASITQLMQVGFQNDVYSATISELRFGSSPKNRTRGIYPDYFEVKKLQIRMDHLSDRDDGYDTQDKPTARRLLGDFRFRQTAFRGGPDRLHIRHERPFIAIRQCL
jgi:hypothetical protein